MGGPAKSGISRYDYNTRPTKGGVIPHRPVGKNLASHTDISIPEPAISMIDHSAPIQAPADSFDSLPREKRVALAAQKLSEAKQSLAEHRWPEMCAATFAAVKLDPDNHQAIALASQLFFSIKRHRDALDLQERYLARHPENLTFLREYCRIASIHGEYTRLLRTTSHLLKSADLPTETRGILLTGAMFAHFGRGEFSQAEALAVHPLIARTHEALLIRVRIRGELGLTDDGLALLDQAIAGSAQDLDLILEKVNLCIGNNRPDAARSAISIGLIFHSRQSRLRLRQLDLLNRPEDLARRRDEILRFRKDFAGDVPAMVMLMEYACANGNTDLVDAIAEDPQLRDSAEGPRFEMIRIESRLTQGRCDEAVTMIDTMPAGIRSRFSSEQLRTLNALRFVTRLATRIPEAAASELSRLNNNTASFNMPMASACAKALLKSGQKEVAIMLVGKIHEAEGERPVDIKSLLEIHLEAGGCPTTPLRLREALNHLRPDSGQLRRALALLSSGQYADSAAIQTLRDDLNLLLSGRPILPPVREADS